MTTGTGVDTEAALLYLEIDLGRQPSLTMFSEQVESLRVLAQHSDLVALNDAGRLGRHEQERIQMVAAGLSLRDAAARLNMSIRVVEPAWQRALRRAGPLPTRVVRTSLASPWVTILGTLAESSQPIAYGTAGLIGLQRLLTMLMRWQKHRVEIERDRAELRTLLDAHAGRTDVRDAVVIAASRLGTVTEADMIEPGDPRART